MTKIETDNLLEQKFQLFFKEKFPQVKKFANLLLKSETDAEDIAQDVFFKLWTHPDIWQKHSSEIDNYLFIMTKNLILNTFKHQKVEEDYRQDLFGSSQVVDLAGRDDVLDDVYYKELLLLLRLTLEKMPERRRQIFELSRFKHLSNKEIADNLNISVRTVEHQIYLALSELKKTLYFFIIFLNLLK